MTIRHRLRSIWVVHTYELQHFCRNSLGQAQSPAHQEVTHLSPSLTALIRGPQQQEPARPSQASPRPRQVARSTGLASPTAATRSRAARLAPSLTLSAKNRQQALSSPVSTSRPVLIAPILNLGTSKDDVRACFSWTGATKSYGR